MCVCLFLCVCVVQTAIAALIVLGSHGSNGRFSSDSCLVQTAIDIVRVCVCVCRDYQLGQSTEVTETRVCCVMRHNKLVCFFGCMSVCVRVCVCVLEIRWALFLERWTLQLDAAARGAERIFC